MKVKLPLTYINVMMHSNALYYGRSEEDSDWTCDGPDYFGKCDDGFDEGFYRACDIYYDKELDIDLCGKCA